MHNTININDRIAQAKEAGKREAVESFYWQCRLLGPNQAYINYCVDRDRKDHLETFRIPTNPATYGGRL